MELLRLGFPQTATAREKLYNFLEQRPAGADHQELMGVLFSGAGSDPEIGIRVVDGLLGADPNFTYDCDTRLWSLRKTACLKLPLEQAQYVVVDLETAAPPATPGAIIEIGAYRMEGRRMVASFQSLVRPLMRIPRFVTGLTSITNEMVLGAPPIEEVMPAFRDFLGEAVMVAHNAQFDHSFLDFEFRRLFGIGLTNPVLCTIRLARRLLPSVKRRRLDLLAGYFGLSTEGRHRALGDARMASELLAIFLEMAARLGLDRLDRLLDYQHRGAAGRRIERHVPPEAIAALPQAPGVYLMRNQRGDVLYVGKAKRLKQRVASYFNTGVSLKAKTAELICHVWEVEARVTNSELEAALTEARLIRELKPPYNRMLKSAVPAFFVRVDLTDPFPRIGIAQKLSARRGAMFLGPFIGKRNPAHAAMALSRILGLRTCSGRLTPDEDFSPCLYGQMGHCAAPCNLTVSEEEYAARVRRAVTFLRGYTAPILRDLARAREQAAAAMRFEEARRLHRDLQALTTFAERASRLSRVLTENNLVAIVGGPTGAPQEREQTGCEVPGVCATAYVVLSGRLVLVRLLGTMEAAREICEFIAANYDLYKLRPVTRTELEAMAIVARWLRERDASDGRLLYLNGPALDPEALYAYARTTQL